MRKLKFWLYAYVGTKMRPVCVYAKRFNLEQEAKAQIENVARRLSPTRVEIIRR